MFFKNLFSLFVCKLLHVSTSGVHHRQLHKHPCLRISDMVLSCIVSYAHTLFVAQSRGLAEQVSVRAIVTEHSMDVLFFLDRQHLVAISPGAPLAPNLVFSLLHYHVIGYSVSCARTCAGIHIVIIRACGFCRLGVFPLSRIPFGSCVTSSVEHPSAVVARSVSFQLHLHRLH